MPVEIKELVIRTVVSDSTEATVRKVAGNNANPAMAESASGTEDIVQECVRQVMRMLAKKQER